MASNIHPTAIVESGAQLGADVTIGAYAYVGSEVTLGDGCVLHHHATVEGFTSLDAQCEVFPFACIGMKTQDLKFRGGRPGTRIGARNVFREYVSVHAATKDGEFTVMGDDNLLLAYCHVAHDCQLGNHIIASNSVGLAGHTIVEDHVTFGAKSGVHQFCRVGTHVMTAVSTVILQDVPPYLMAAGNTAQPYGLNVEGLKRRGFTADAITALKRAYRTLYKSGLLLEEAKAKLAEEAKTQPDVQRFVDFLEVSKRGIIR